MKHQPATPTDASKNASKPSNGKPANGKAINGKAVHTSPSAQSLYENHGGGHGSDVEDWLAAEAALRAEQGLAHT
jgi:hypothetical protein